MHSFSYNQFKGEVDNEAKECWPVRTNAEMEKTTNLLGETLNPDAVAFPCGLIAKTVFNGIDNNILVLNELCLGKEGEKIVFSKKRSSLL